MKTFTFLVLMLGCYSSSIFAAEFLATDYHTTKYTCKGTPDRECQVQIKQGLNKICNVKSVLCSNGRCIAIAPNCKFVSTNGFGGTTCYGGKKIKPKFNGKIKVHTDFTDGVLNKRPQDLCVANGEIFARPIENTSDYVPSNSPDVPRKVGGTLNTTCKFDEDSQEKNAQKCEDLTKEKLEGGGCSIQSISCAHDSSNGKQNCSTKSSNCQVTSSTGLSPTCKIGKKKNVGLGRLGSKIKLNPGYTMGIFNKAPQQVCVSDIPKTQDSSAPAGSNETETRP